MENLKKLYRSLENSTSLLNLDIKFLLQFHFSNHFLKYTTKKVIWLECPRVQNSGVQGPSYPTAPSLVPEIDNPGAFFLLYLFAVWTEKYGK